MKNKINKIDMSLAMQEKKLAKTTWDIKGLFGK